MAGVDTPERRAEMYRAAPAGDVRLSVVIPAYDELPNLRELLPRLREVIAGVDAASAEVIVVVRNAAEEAELTELRELGATPVRRAPTDSFGDAMRSGLSSVDPSTDLVVTLDADGSHDPATLPRLLKAADRADVVVASRYVAGGETDNSFALRAMSRCLNVAYGVVLGIHCRDVSTNYKLYRRADIEGLQLVGDSFDIVEELLFRIKQRHGADFVIAEVPDHFYERRHGVTKRRLGPFIVSYLTTLARLRRQASRGGQ
jgi:dolichol-phosphate mannosyltransferase